MKSLLIALLISTGAFAEPTGPYVTVITDPCVEGIKRAVGAIEFSTNFLNKIREVNLLSVGEERTYQLNFNNLAGHYELILDNDNTNKCFLIQARYVFHQIAVCFGKSLSLETVVFGLR